MNIVLHHSQSSVSPYYWMLSLLSNDLDRGEFLYFPGATGADRTLTIDNNGNLYLGSVQRVPQYTMTSTLGARYIRPVAGKWAKDPNLTCSALAVGIGGGQAKVHANASIPPYTEF